MSLRSLLRLSIVPNDRTASRYAALGTVIRMIDLKQNDVFVLLRTMVVIVSGNLLIVDDDVRERIRVVKS
jgi:hypothetical protein